MDDIKQKLIFLGGFLSLVVIGFFGYSSMGMDEPSCCPDDFDDNIPFAELMGKFKEITTYQQAEDFYNKYFPIVENKASVSTKGIMLSQFNEIYSQKLSSEIKRFCRYDTLNITHYRSVRDETVSLQEKMKQNANLKAPKKNIDTLLNILYRFHAANMLPDKVEERVASSLYSIKQYDEYNADILKYKGTSFINKNTRVLKGIRKCENLLSMWKEDHSKFTTLYSNQDHVEVIMTNCEMFNTLIYKTECDEQRYKSYRHHFTKESRDVHPGDPRKSQFVLKELDCSLIRNAPLSKKLKSMRGAVNEEGSFFKDCRGIKRKFSEYASKD